MTEFHGNPVYFPVAAVVVLLILCVLAVSARPRYRPSRRRLSSACMALLRKTKNRAALVFHTRNRSPPELPISNQQTAALPRTPTDNMEPYAPPSVPYYHNGNQHTMAHPVPVPHYQDRNQQLVALSPTDAMEHYARPSIPFYHYANQQTMAYPTNTIVP